MRKYFTRSNLGTAIGVVVSIYLLVILGGVIKHNHDLQTQVNSLNGQINSLNQQKKQLSYEISYYQTDAFKEQAARAKLGLVDPGESVVILPQDSASSNQGNNQPTKKSPSHIAQWWQFLFGN